MVIMEKDTSNVATSGSPPVEVDGNDGEGHGGASARDFLIERRKLWIKVYTWFGLWAAAALIATAHFLLYFYLNGKVANNQQVVLKAGTAFAFLYKDLLGASASMAIVPMVWRTVGADTFSFSGLDKLFKVPQSVSGILNKEVLRKAKLVAAFGVALVLISIAGISPPGTLTVGRRADVAFDAPCNIPSVDFRKVISQDTRDIRFNPNNDWHWNGSIEATSLISLVSYGGIILQVPSPCAEPNCTFSVGFRGPSLKCDKTSSLSASPWNDSAPFPDVVAPALHYTAGQHAEDGNVWLAWGAPVEKDVSYTSDGIPWGSVASSTDLRSNKGGVVDAELHISKCTLYNASYNLDFSFRNGLSSVAVKTDLLNPYDTGLRFNYLDADLELRWESWRGFGLLDTLYDNFLSGYIDVRATEADNAEFYSTTNLVATKLAREWLIETQGHNLTQFFPVTNLDSRLEELFRNITVSILGRPFIDIRTQKAGTCTNMHDFNVYRFDIMIFWVSYGVGLLLGVAAIRVGAYCLFMSGRDRDASFTSVAAATMDDRLGAIVREGNEPEERLSHVHVKFDHRFKVYDQ